MPDFRNGTQDRTGRRKSIGREAADTILRLVAEAADRYIGHDVQIAFTSPPSIRSADPVIHLAPGDTRKAISSAISSGSP